MEIPGSRGRSSPPEQCHTCRKRRVRCDSTRPACNKCVSKGVECLGYGKQKPLIWLQGGGNQNQYLAEGSKSSSEPPKRKKGRPKILVAKDETGDKRKAPEGEHSNGNEVLDLVATASDLSDSLVKFDPHNIPAALDFKYPLDVKVVVSTLWYFNKYVYPDIDPIIYYQSLPSVDPKSWQDDISNLLLHVLVTVVATHKAIQTQPDDQVSFGHELYQYKQQAFNKLNVHLQNPSTQLGDLTLICVMSLLMMEAQQSAYGEWWAHFEGARKIIELKGGIKAIYDQSPFLKSCLTYYILNDVFSATTSPGVLSMAEASRQYEYTEILTSVYQNGSETCVPCPNELLSCVIQINYFRSLSIHAVGSIDFSISVQTLLQNILSFSALDWADSMSQYFATTAIVRKGKELAEFIQPDRDDWFQIASLYQAATLLYCIRALVLDFEGLILAPYRTTTADMVSYVTVQDIQIIARQTFFDRLGKIFAPGTDVRHQSLARVVIWPLCVAGIEAGDDFEDALELRELVSGALRRLSKALGTLSLRDARTFLVNEWDRRDQIRNTTGYQDYQCWWGEIFDRLPCKSAFFM
ncbi:hypothetical protein FQN52_004377 [Onygenales sp. PD_12]|nr:hypothetical protein FQN52_004377 [Onygenales sp. PD_12]